MNTIKTSDEAMTKVFQKRKKIGMYNSLPVETKKKLNICYLSNSHPSRNEIQEISRKLAIPTTKVENWFKYQRKKSLNQKTNNKHRFNKEDIEILEKYFRDHQKLMENDLALLKIQLKCHKSHLKRWFYYRNKKLEVIKRDMLKIKLEKEGLTPKEQFIPCINNASSFISYQNYLLNMQRIYNYNAYASNLRIEEYKRRQALSQFFGGFGNLYSYINVSGFS